MAARIEREENLAHKTKNKRTDLTPTGLLMALARFIDGAWIALVVSRMGICSPYGLEGRRKCQRS